MTRGAGTSSTLPSRLIGALVSTVVIARAGAFVPTLPVGAVAFKVGNATLLDEREKVVKKGATVSLGAGEIK